MQKLIFKEDSADPEIVSYRHNSHFIGKAFNLFECLG